MLLRTPTLQAYRTDRFEGWLKQPADTGPGAVHQHVAELRQPLGDRRRAARRSRQPNRRRPGRPRRPTSSATAGSRPPARLPSHPPPTSVAPPSATAESSTADESDDGGSNTGLIIGIVIAPLSLPASGPTSMKRRRIGRRPRVMSTRLTAAEARCTLDSSSAGCSARSGRSSSCWSSTSSCSGSSATTRSASCSAAATSRPSRSRPSASSSTSTARSSSSSSPTCKQTLSGNLGDSILSGRPVTDRDPRGDVADDHARRHVDGVLDVDRDHVRDLRRVAPPQQVRRRGHDVLACSRTRCRTSGSACCLLSLFAVQLGWFPTGGFEDAGSTKTGLAALLDQLHHMFLPALTLTLAYIGEYMIVMRSSLIDTLSEDYLQLAQRQGSARLPRAPQARGAERVAAGREPVGAQLRLHPVGRDRGRGDLLVAGSRPGDRSRPSAGPTTRCCKGCSCCSAPR